MLKQAANTDSVLRALRTHFDSPLAHCHVSVGAEAANVRRVTLQVRDRIRSEWPDTWLVLVYLTTTSGGDPSSTGNTVEFVTGNVFTTMLPNGAWEVISDEDGVIAFDVTITGAATRYVVSAVRGKVRESEAIAWL